MGKSFKIISILILTLVIFTGAASAQELLRVGSRGSAVSSLQKDLNTLGYAPGAADGIFGSRTRGAVVSFQSDNRLGVDGIVGNQTFTAIENNLTGNNGTSSKPGQNTNDGKGTSSFNRLLRNGSRGEDVKSLQNSLKVLGYSVGAVDGIFGGQTRSAVLEFQRDNKLSADGIAGPQTLNALSSAPKKDSNTNSNRGQDSQSIVNNIIGTAKSFVGVPYRTAGTTPNGFDCSGFTQYVMKQNGISIPRTSSAQNTIGTSVSRNNLKTGDLVFFNTSGSGVSHVGIYVGNNSFISSTSSNGVSIVSLSNSYWSPRYIGAKRII